MKEISISINSRENRTELILHVEKEVRKAWEKRANAQGYKKKHITYKRFKTEFMLGMVAAMDVILNAEETKESSITPGLYFEILRGE